MGLEQCIFGLMFFVFFMIYFEQTLTTFPSPTLRTTFQFQLLAASLLCCCVSSAAGVNKPSVTLSSVRFYVLLVDPSMNASIHSKCHIFFSAK